MQFGIMPGKGTTNAIFILRQVQEKHQEKKKKLYYAFVDLEKAFDRFPREVVRWALMKLGVDEWLIRTVMPQGWPNLIGMWTGGCPTNKA